ncbi:MAG TPA: lytic murein transglycosylase [Rhizobacter sp.]|nr:lytic murein transglycosylase [Rhizobacter sp.]
MVVVMGLAGLSAQAATEPDIAPCLRQLRAMAPSQAGILPQVFDQFVTNIQYDARLAEPGIPQPEFFNPTWEYVAYLVDDQRIAEGRDVMARWWPQLQYIQAQTGVAPETVVAFFGVETDYGRYHGTYRVLQALANRACGPISATTAAKANARRQFYAAIEVLRLGDVAPEDFLGSFAGAFGHTQFIPSTYLEHRGQPGNQLADGDQDGKVDPVHSVPDALMLTAKKVRADGWQPGLPWALAVTLPTGFDRSLALRERAFGGTLYGRVAKPLLDANRRPLSEWLRRGVVLDAPPADLSPDTPFVLLSMNDDAEGPYLLASANFEAHYKYNFSLNYAYAVGLLADYIKGEVPPQLRWAGDQRGLSRVEIRELQCLLAERNADIKVDGNPGTRTRLAISAEETRLGWKPTGRTTDALLNQLRDAASPDSPCFN